MGYTRKDNLLGKLRNITLLGLLLLALHLHLAGAYSFLPSNPTYIKEQSYNSSFTCPEETSCTFHCTREIAACLSNYFYCEPFSRCDIYCDQVLSCSKLRLYCLDNATCSVKCGGLGSCNRLKLVEVGLGAVVDLDLVESYVGVFSRTIKATVIEAFAFNNVRVKNVIAVPEGGLQVLSYEFPSGSDERRSLMESVRVKIYDLIREMNRTVWLDFPAYNYSFIHENVIFVYGNDFANKALFIACLDLLDRFEWSNVLTPISIRYFPDTLKAEHQLHIIDLDLFHNQSLGAAIFHAFIAYTNDLFGLPANSSLVNLTYTVVNNTLKTLTTVMVDNKCTRPGPFYASYCFNSKWYSTGTLSITLDDLLVSPTYSHHEGSLTISETPFQMRGTTLVTQDSFSSTSKSVLTLNDSTLTVGNGMSLTDSLINFYGNSSVTIQNNLTISASTLTITLNSDTLSYLKDKGVIEVELFNSGSGQIQGDFDNISLTANETYCYKISGNKASNRYSVIIELTSCYSPNSTEWIIAVSLCSTLIPTILIVALVIYLRNRSMEQKVRNIGKRNNY